MMSFEPSSKYLDHLPPIPDLSFKDNAFLAADFERMKRREQMANFDAERYKLEAPSDDSGVEAWKKAMDNCKAQVQHQSVRIENLDLMNEHGPTAWQMHNTALEQIQKSIHSKLEATQTQIEEVNKKRKI